MTSSVLNRWFTPALAVPHGGEVSHQWCILTEYLILASQWIALDQEDPKICISGEAMKHNIKSQNLIGVKFFVADSSLDTEKMGKVGLVRS